MSWKPLEEKRNSLVEEMTKHEEWLQKWKAGGYIVGYANIGDIRFRWTDKEKSVAQYLWWQYPDNQVKTNDRDRVPGDTGIALVR